MDECFIFTTNNNELPGCQTHSSVPGVCHSFVIGRPTHTSTCTRCNKDIVYRLRYHFKYLLQCFWSLNEFYMSEHKFNVHFPLHSFSDIIYDTVNEDFMRIISNEYLYLSTVFTHYKVVNGTHPLFNALYFNRP